MGFYFLIHFAIFAIPVSIGLGLLSVIVRKIAETLHVRTPPFSLVRFTLAALSIGMTGAIGQGIFQTLYTGAGWNVGPARYPAYALTGLLTGAVAHVILPCTKLRRAAIYGLIGGVIAEFGFAQMAAHFGDMPARIVSEAVLSGIIALAVRFELETSPIPEINEPNLIPETVQTPELSNVSPLAAVPDIVLEGPGKIPGYAVQNVILPAGGRIRNCTHCLKTHGKISNR